MPLKNIFVALITLFISTTDAKPLDGYRITEILVLKNKHTLLLLSGPIVIRKYNISLGANPVGHKVREGDERTPEGHYKIDYKNENSGYFRSLHINYPNKKDRARAQKFKVDPGGNIMIHGLKNGFENIMLPVHFFYDWTDGCIAVTNNEIQEIWDSVDVGTPVIIIP